MTKKELDERLTTVIKRYLDDGYHFHLASMAGSDGTQGVNLIKEKAFIRIYLERRNGKIFLIIAGKTLKNYDDDLIFSSSLKEISKETFYEVERNKWYVDECEAKRITSIRKQRDTHLDSRMSKQSMGDAAKQIVLPFVNRLQGHETKTVRSIHDVVKVIEQGYGVRYYVCLNNCSYRLK